MKSSSEKYRIFLSRIASLLVLVLFACAEGAWESRNEVLELGLFFIGLALVGVASLGRMWCSLYIAGYKNSRLITEGPYSVTRNPLYFLSLIGVVGVGFATETFTFPVLLTILFVSYYGAIIKSEERRLRAKFGRAYDDYADAVPAFFPRFSKLTEPEDYLVRPAVYRRHMLSALWFVWIVGLLEVLEGLKEMGVLKTFWTLY